jgi:hypothetical protein
MFDISELIKRIVKYLVLGAMLALASFLIPKKTMNVEEIGLIALSGAAIFAILDTYLPSFAVSARQGAGFSLGASILGGVPIMS